MFPLMEPPWSKLRMAACHIGIAACASSRASPDPRPAGQAGRRPGPPFFAHEPVFTHQSVAQYRHTGHETDEFVRKDKLVRKVMPGMSHSR